MLIFLLLLGWYCFGLISTLILSLIVMTINLFSENFFLESKKLSDARVVLITKKNMILQSFYCKDS